MQNPKPIYLDNNATTQTDPRVVESILPYFLEQYANPDSPHLEGLHIKESIENATWQVADLINAKENEIIFTSGATEAINLAIKGLKHSDRKKIITFTTEHKAVLETCRFMETEGFEIEYLPVNSDGLIDFELLNDSVDNQTLMVIIMMANNETGTLQDMKKISQIVHSCGAYLLCDTTQAVGKIPVDVSDLGIDMLTISAHKFHGPKGIGALYVSKKSEIILSPQIHGGGQQRNLRSSTMNVPGIIGLGKAAEIAKSEMDEESSKIGFLRDYLEAELLKIEGTFVNGTTVSRIYNTTNICFRGVFAENLIISLGNISVSNGSACSSVTSRPSHVLKGLGLSDEDALSSIRFSLGRFNTLEEVEKTIFKVTEIVNRLKS